jgi:hypothetical protein
MTSSAHGLSLKQACRQFRLRLVLVSSILPLSLRNRQSFCWYVSQDTSHGGRLCLFMFLPSTALSQECRARYLAERIID